MSKKVIDGLKNRNEKETKQAIKELLVDKIFQKIEEKKKELSKELLGEAETSATEEEPAPVDNKEPEDSSLKTIRSKFGPNSYRFQFPFKSRIYVVDIVPSDKNSGNNFVAKFYAKGFQDNPEFTKHFGISSTGTIEPVFANVVKVIQQFLDMRHPQTLRFVAGNKIDFPNIFHQYIYSVLEKLGKDLKGKYSLVRGDSTKDGSAFILRRGGSQSLLRTKGWRPGTKKPEADVKEDIANAVGDGSAVKTDRPLKSGLGLPGLAKETEKEKKRQMQGMKTAIEKRKQ